MASVAVKHIIYIYKYNILELADFYSIIFNKIIHFIGLWYKPSTSSYNYQIRPIV